MQFFKTHKIKFVIILIVAGGGYWYTQSDRTEEPAVAAVVVEQVGRGDVTSGIETTGEIVAAQKLNLDVYKQISRIDLVNVINGGTVAAGDVLFTFDASNALVAVESSRVGVLGAELTLENQRANVTDPNSTIRTLENDIVALEADIAQAGVDKNRAYRAYLNANLEPVPDTSNTVDKVKPTISGLYTATTEGDYQVSVYRSGAESGYSYRVVGLESNTESVLLGMPSLIGQSGLEITFPLSVATGDAWIIAVPNTYAPEYVATLELYEETITTLELLVVEAGISIQNKQQEIEDILQTDTTQFRDLGVSQAQAELAQAREQLSQNFDVVQEQSIVAPFSGTVEGMENVVVGASPTRDTNDPITLGTLISDDFLVTFSLSAVDVAKVSVGQLVLVNITSFPDIPTLEATINEISSLPNSEGVAQYAVQALINLPPEATVQLREGLLADIEIVQEVAVDVVRVPSAAIVYENRQAQVRVLTDLTSEQQETITTLNIIRTMSDQSVGFMVDVEIGIAGAFYSEIIGGLTEGQYVVIGDTNDTESALTESRRGGRPNND